MDQRESNFVLNSRANKYPVKSLTEAVSVTKQLISATPNKSDKTEQLQSTNDHLKYLYTSIQLGKPQSFNTSPNRT